MSKFASPAIQAINLIRYIGDEVLESARPIDQLSGISEIIGSPSEESADKIIEELHQQGLISMREPVEALDGTLFINVSLTLDGWERHEATKRGGLAGNYGFIAMKTTTLCAAALVVFLPHGVVAEEWRGLVVAPEERCAPYDASEYSYPQSVEPRISDSLGGIYSSYTCEMFGEFTETDIEHVVARSEAHDSGLCAASPESKSKFARDMRNLTFADPDLNRDEKGASNAADWMPDESRCWFAWRVIDVRRAYGLTIDRREADALDAILAACPESSPDTLPACPNIPKERRP